VTDDELIKKAKTGDENAAELLIKRYYSQILRYCRWHCPDIETAEDLTQETFIRLFQRLNQYNGKGKFKSYLYTIANRLCIDESRKTRSYPLKNDESLVGSHDNLHQIEDRDEIARLLSLLSPEQKEAVFLRFSEELSFSEIARVTGCNLRTAQSRVRNGLNIMRKGEKHAR